MVAPTDGNQDKRVTLENCFLNDIEWYDIETDDYYKVVDIKVTASFKEFIVQDFTIRKHYNDIR
ncbi:MAG: hypothetical protein WCE94_15720 [Candidatus Methanoperedens sp.]